ncbi:MAG: tRNA pseudouridine(55) synthase TruB [Candidatus Omnitrophica bacterium]|nr:tRNA pseudouridine(55) synthase TruB [Candidatus Omnitrophota bacterium]
MNGILLVDKPILYTSHDMVDVVRRKTGIRRVGHAGTLDPMATGLLIMLLGPSTSLFQDLSVLDKDYEGIMTLGMETRTQDLEGMVTRTASYEHIREKDVRAAFGRFTGKIQQTVPQYSSAKVKGKKGYELARKSIPFDAPVKTVEIKRLDLLRFSPPDVYFSTRVSKGTYLRAVCADVGSELGAGMVLSSLRRTRVGAFDVADSLSPENLKRLDGSEIARRAADALTAWKKRPAESASWLSRIMPGRNAR